MFRRIFRKKTLPKDEMLLICELEDKLGYVFKDVNLLKRALSHKSYTNEKKLSELHHNERLEFLGDAVLELLISDLLMTYFAKSREGLMSKVRASLVNESALAEQAKKLGLGKFIFLGRGEEQGDGRQKPSLLSDTLEALFGAIYLDSDFTVAYSVIRGIFEPEVERATKEDITRDYKTKVQELSQTLYKEPPEYKLIHEEGPDHEKVFTIDLLIKGEKISSSKGKSKKQAEQRAAKKAISILKEKMKSKE